MVLPATLVAQLIDLRKTRLICTLERKHSFRCGLNHLGNGNYFIILSRSNLDKTGKGLGEMLRFEIEEDPDPLEVTMPEVLQVLLDQDK